MDVNVLLFPDFEPLDVFGPVEIFSRIEKYRLQFLSAPGGIMSSKRGAGTLTIPAVDADHAGILLIPGGQGTRTLVNDAAFIEKLKQLAIESTYCLTVCTGSALLAKTGLLDGRKATSNKKAFNWVRSVNGNVDWIAHARWVADGKFYTSSGVSAGMDMSLGFVNDRFGKAAADEIANAMEYIWNSDKDNDPFARRQ